MRALFGSLQAIPSGELADPSEIRQRISTLEEKILPFYPQGDQQRQIFESELGQLQSRLELIGRMEEVCRVACTCVPIEGIPSNLTDDPTDLWAAAQGILSKAPKDRTKKDKDLLDALAKQYGKCRQDLDFVDRCLSENGASPEGIRQIAMGAASMLEPSPGLPPSQKWGVICQNPLQYSNGVQGSIDRQQIVDAFRYQQTDPFLAERMGWIHEWIVSGSPADGMEKATEEDLEKFLEFITGSPGIPAQGLNFHHVPTGMALPQAHTCFFQMDLSSCPLASYNTKAGFIAKIKEATATIGTGYTMG